MYLGDAFFNIFEQTAVFGTNVLGIWPHGGASLGITNIKSAISGEISGQFPSQFAGVKWANLAGNDDLAYDYPSPGSGLMWI